MKICCFHRNAQNLNGMIKKGEIICNHRHDFSTVFFCQYIAHQRTECIFTVNIPLKDYIILLAPFLPLVLLCAQSFLPRNNWLTHQSKTLTPPPPPAPSHSTELHQSIWHHLLFDTFDDVQIHYRDWSCSPGSSTFMSSPHSNPTRSTSCMATVLLRHLVGEPEKETPFPRDLWAFSTWVSSWFHLEPWFGSASSKWQLCGVTVGPLCSADVHKPVTLRVQIISQH